MVRELFQMFQPDKPQTLNVSGRYPAEVFLYHLYQRAQTGTTEQQHPVADKICESAAQK